MIASDITPGADYLAGIAHAHIADKAERAIFEKRLALYFPSLYYLLTRLYGEREDFPQQMEAILVAAARQYQQRSKALKAHDLRREAAPLWFQSEHMMGAVCYVDRFAGTLQGLREKLDYLKELGITYLHLMPLFKCPPERNDGGYAVSSFREVNPALGTMEELATLAAHMREHDISLVLDFVFNHTSEEHDWALRAKAGDRQYQDYYRMFEDRVIPDQFERTLREIFPEQAPGSFTYNTELKKWVWTTFFQFQWDLNYENPQVFCAMMEEMLFLANQGVEILRLDAVPFIWKRIGTNSENLPEAHLIIQAYNLIARIVAPALLFKSEAIVHPRDVKSYIRHDECQLSYNPIMMVCLWDALATRDVRLLTHTMRERFALPAETAWINYVRSHDDIGWGFADEDAAQIGINGDDHRFFLNLFYTGRFPKSFAKGVPFNYNPRTLDMRISGTTASLSGLEKAILHGDHQQIEHAIRRIILIQGITLAAGGIPLIYLGDELATCNDNGYHNDPAHADDSRWLHRPQMDWSRAQRRNDPATPEGKVYQALKHLIKLRKATPLFANGETQFLNTGSFHVLGFTRHQDLLVLANFSEREQTVHLSHFAPSFMQEPLHDIISGRLSDSPDLTLLPYEMLWLKRGT
jgi:glycosidase